MSRLENNVKQDVDVLFWWEILCAVVNVGNDAASELLSEVMQHFVVVHGFAFTSKWMEQYKVNNNLQLMINDCNRCNGEFLFIIIFGVLFGVCQNSTS